MAIKSATLANGKMLTFEEIQAARILCLQEAQKCFMEVCKLLTENKPLHRSSQLVKLSPIICKDGLLRVGGRAYDKSSSRSFCTFCKCASKVLDLWCAQAYKESGSQLH